MKTTIFLKRLVSILALCFFLYGCSRSIKDIENKYGPPHKVKPRGDKTVYYYYSFEGETTEYTTDLKGKIIKKRKYDKPPKSEPQGQPQPPPKLEPKQE